MYDFNSSPFVLGFLCTGTTWLFFRMDLEETSSTFPHATMRCLAKGALLIIKDFNLDTGPKIRRSSASLSETVNENEVLTLMELFAAFILFG